MATAAEFAPPAAALKKNKDNGLRWSWKYYDGDSHGTVPLISEYDGLRYTFDYYNFRFERALDNDFGADSAVALFKDHYRLISQKMGYMVLPPEELVNMLGYTFLQRSQPGKSAAFFKMNTENYPKSANTFDSLGDLYSETGDRGKAIEAYTKALSLRDDPDTRKKLEEQKAKKPGPAQ